MSYFKFKSIQVLFNGSLIFNKSNFNRNNIQILKKDWKNFGGSKKGRDYIKIKDKSFPNCKTKYVTYK